MLIVANHVHHAVINEFQDLWWKVFRSGDLDFIVDLVEAEARTEVDDLNWANDFFLEVKTYQDILRLEIAVDKAHLFEHAQSQKNSLYHFLELLTVVFLENVADPNVLLDLVDSLTFIESSLLLE